MKILPAAAVVALLLAAPFLAKAEPFPRASVPAAAKWVVHIDMDAARDTKLWQLVQDKIIAPHQPGFDKKINALETITGMKFPRDLHDVTLYGTSFNKDDAVILIHAAVNQAQITDMLKLDPEFRADAHNDHDVLTWRDKDKDRLMYGAFFGNDHVIIGATQKLVETALDTLDDRAKVLQPPAPGAAPATDEARTADAIVYVASSDLSGLQKAQNPPSPLVAQAESGWLTIAELDQKIVAKAGVKAKTEKAAERMQAMAEGLKAMLALAASADKADDKTKAASAALDTLTIRRSGDTIKAELPITLDALQSFIEAAHIGQPAPGSKLP